jgi:4-amino-4-deoxy-L-arabinose transferase-like glycosyltransferase
MERNQSGGRVAAFCAALLFTFAGLSWFAVRTKSPTMDEPLHAVGSYLHVFERDDRINPEDPPLWKYWAMAPHRRGSFPLDLSNEDYVRALKNTELGARFAVQTLYVNPHADRARADEFLDRSRAMMLLAGVALGGLVAWWGWKIAGATCALVATALFALDPNFIAHAPLIKNDVSITLCFLATAFAAWSVGRAVRWWNILLLGLLCGATLATKFSGVLMLPIVALLLAFRAALRSPWHVFGRVRTSRATKLLTAAGLMFLTIVCGVTVVWASYGFRFDPTPIPEQQFNLQSLIDKTKENKYFLSHDHRFPVADELPAMSTPALARGVELALGRRLLPYPYLYGFLYTYQSSLVRSGFLLGEHRVDGWWYYFPLAMLFKTPLATLLSIATALVALILLRSRAADPWTTACLTIPIIGYGASAMATNLNLGLRHVLPLYPFIYLLIGRLATRAQARWPRAFKPAAAVLAAALATESFAAFPNYIPFFNAVSRPFRLTLLSDSNLDWGQDLPLLKQWQDQNPSKHLYLAYFGSARPDSYDIGYFKIPGGYFLRPDLIWPDEPGGVIAISATLLQGTHLPPSLQKYYAPLRTTKPRAVLGDSIYLFDIPQPPLPRITRQDFVDDAGRK